MKKVILLFSFVAMLAACSGNKSVNTTEQIDSISVVTDSMAVDSIIVDTLNIDSIN